MTWSLSASGHKDSPAEEARLALDLHGLFGGGRHTGWATMSTTNFGGLDLCVESLPEAVYRAAQEGEPVCRDHDLEKIRHADGEVYRLVCRRCKATFVLAD